MDQIAKDVGVDLHTESLLLRAEQLAKLEYDKNIDKVRIIYYVIEIKFDAFYVLAMAFDFFFFSVTIVTARLSLYVDVIQASFILRFPLQRSTIQASFYLYYLFCYFIFNFNYNLPFTYLKYYYCCSLGEYVYIYYCYYIFN